MSESVTRDPGQRCLAERLRAEYALKTSENWYRRLFEAAKDGILILDADTGKIVDVNPFLTELTGNSREEFLGKQLWEIGPFRDIAASRISFAELQAKQYVRYEDLPLEARDGRKIDVEFVSNVYHVDSQNVIQCNVRDITARKRAEKRAEDALEESEKRYRRLFEAAKDGILILDADTGKIVDVNPFLIELTGYSREEFLGKQLWEIGSFNDIAASMVSFAELQAKHYIRYEDLPLETRDGRKIAVEFVSNVYRVDNQSVIQCNIRDITDRKKALDREQRLNKILRAIRNVNQLIVREKDPHKLIQKASDMLVESRGYQSAWIALASGSGPAWAGASAGLGESFEPVAEKMKKGVWPSCCERANGSDKGLAILNPATDCSDCSLWKSDGLETCVIVVLRYEAKIHGFCGISIPADFPFDESLLIEMADDLGLGVHGIELEKKRQENEEAVRQSEERFRILFEQASDIILFLEIKPEGVPVIRDANSATFRILGYERDELIGRPVSFIEAEPDASNVVKERRKNILSGIGTVFEAGHRCKDGGIRDFECSVTEMQIGSKTFGISVERDVTERKRAEAERGNLEEQFRVSQKMEAIGSLAGGIAHDFNNLLSVILSYTFFAMDGLPDDDPRGDDMKEVKLAAERAAALTRQLLAFSRKQMLQPVMLDLNRIAEGIEKMLRRILGEDIDFLQVLEPDLGVVRADPGQIEQVLMNLAVNARDAMPEGGKLTIETANVEIDEEYASRHMDTKPGPYVMLAVTDTGCGMDEEIKSRLFEPFFTTKEKDKGTGLGLPTVYGIVKQSGGNIWVYSELGQGTTFKVYLPRELEAIAVDAAKPSRLPTRCIGNETILLVEDEEALRKVAKRALDAVGYKVLLAAGGDEALLVSEEYAGEIHLLLTDVVMPRMSGRALAQELAKTRPALKILYMSGYTDNAIFHHGVLDAGTNFVGKPFTAKGLAEKVRKVLDGGDVADPGTRYERTVEDEVETKHRPLDRDALRTLPNDILDRLLKAVIAARYDEIVELIETIRITDPEMANGLRRMADLFDYDGMRNLLGKREEGPNDG
jgi:PAS domain S-box-containing protein